MSHVMFEYCTESEKIEWLSGHRMVVSASVVCPADFVAVRGLWGLPSAQHHQRILYPMPLAQGKIKI